MATPMFVANAAYGQAQKLVRNPDQGMSNSLAAGQGGGPDFGKLLAESIQSVASAGQQSEKMTVDMVNGKANVVDVVTSISQTELAMESLVSVRDRVISAYEEIMRMPI